MNLNVIILTLGLILKRCSLKPTLDALFCSFLSRKTVYSQIALELQNNIVKPLFSGHPVLSGRIFQFFLKRFLPYFLKNNLVDTFIQRTPAKIPQVSSYLALVYETAV